MRESLDWVVGLTGLEHFIRCKNPTDSDCRSDAQSNGDPRFEDSSFEEPFSEHSVRPDHPEHGRCTGEYVNRPFDNVPVAECQDRLASKDHERCPDCCTSQA